MSNNVINVKPNWWCCFFMLLFFLSQETWYLDIQHNTAIHIASVEVHDQTEDMCTL